MRNQPETVFLQPDTPDSGDFPHPLAPTGRADPR